MAALATERLLPGEGGDIDLVPVDVLGERARGSIGEGQTFAVGGNPVAIGDADAARGSVPGEQNVGRPVDLAQIGKLAIVGPKDGRVQFELLDRVGDPSFAEAFPSQGGHPTLAEHGPHGHLERAGVAAGNDADPVRLGKPKQFAHQVDAILKPRLAERAAVRAAQDFGVELVGGPARRLGAGAGREIRPGRTDLWLGRAHSGARVEGIGHVTLLTESARRVGTAWPGTVCKGECGVRKANAKDSHRPMLHCTTD